MITQNTKRMLSAVLTLLLSAVSPPRLNGVQDPAGDAGNPTEAAPMSLSQLQALVAPIALYPDALVAQILAAATFPDQVAVAEYWLQQNKKTGKDLMQAVDKESWDASVKALTQFPSVLDNLSNNLAWTSSLGEAYHNQQADVMTAIQTLRAKAQAAGNLKSTPQITVVQQTPQTIVIQPANPEIVYVPQYNPMVVYGYPYVVPSYVAPPYNAADAAAAGIIGFGAGIAVGAMMGGGGCCGWGYSSWDCNWHSSAVVYHGGAYYGNSAWHGGYYNGGYHDGYGYHNAYNRNVAQNNYNNYKGGHNTNVSGNTVNINKQNASFSGDHSSASNSWAQHDSGGRSDAFSGMSGRSGGWGSGGWSSRADSGRGWGSMRSGGFGGGRFGGGGGGFGGGRFGGGGFRGRR